MRSYLRTRQRSVRPVFQTHPSTPRTPYVGDELRIDGYYLSEQTISGSDYGLAVLYRNGVCYYLYGSADSQPLEADVEQNVLLNRLLIDRLRTTPTGIGVFEITGDSIFIQQWEKDRDIVTQERRGVILNDTTFVLTSVENLQREFESVSWTYRFIGFSPKPDSATAFIQ